MKKILLSIIIIILLSYMKVNANIMCKDGSKSRSCADCHQGCCSGHGGCKRDSQGNDIIYNESSNNNNTQSSNAASISNTSTNNDNQEDNDSNNSWVGWVGGIATGAIIANVATKKK